jgi:TPR repeat protein
LSNDPFSQIEVNTSAFTEITDQSTISRKSLFPVYESLEVSSSNHQPFLLSATTAHSILYQLNSHPQSVHLILNEAYHRAREQNDVNDWTEFYIALDQYTSQTSIPFDLKSSAVVYLARCFIFGLGTEKNVEHGLSLLTNHSSCETIYALGKYYLDGIDNQYIDQAKAFEYIKTASEYNIMNNSMLATVNEAQCTLARILFQGEGVAQNSNQALDYLMKSAENDNM